MLKHASFHYCIEERFRWISTPCVAIVSKSHLLRAKDFLKPIIIHAFSTAILFRFLGVGENEGFCSR